MSIKAVFFDIDGTLVDSNEFHVKAWKQAFAEQSFPVQEQDIRQQIGKGGDMLIPALVANLDGARAKAIDEDHARIFRSRYLAQVKAFPCAAALIRTLHERGRKVLLASSAKRDELEHHVNLLGVKNLIADTVCADDVEKSKPAGDIFAAALAKVAPIGPHEVLAAGDTPYDVISAGKCHIRTVALRTGPFSDSQLQQAGAIAIYTDLAALLKGLEDPPLRELFDG